MKLAEIIKRNRELGARLTGDKYRIALISNITVSLLKEILERTLREEGINAIVTVGDFDAIVQDSARLSDFNAVLVFWEAGNFIEGFHNQVESMSQVKLDALAERVEGEMELMLANLQNTPLVLLNHFSSEIFCSDSLSIRPLTSLCNRLNTKLRDQVGPNQLIVDHDKVFSKVGVDNSVDFRQFQSAKALYSVDFFKAYAEAVMPAFMAATGRAKKVLVLDCDNTLWSGVLGEDGIGGIEMSDATIKGKSFREVQTILKGYRTEGILLALCSKNNSNEIDEVLNHHKDMVLTESDLVARRVNWEDKATNLRELSAELNLGLDSFVFVDDSPFEIGLVTKALPQVKCMQVPQNISEYPALMRRLRREFFNLSRTAEDDRKTEMYREEQQRKNQAGRFDTIDEYLASLGLKLKVLWDTDIPISRAAQMTQKTNQFNLTTKRYTEAEIQRMANDPSYSLATFSVSDRYGDYGVTGLAIIQRAKELPESGLIDTLLMSCRVIGRKIEHKFFDEVVRNLHDNGIQKLNAEYLATSKNSQVANLYDDLGFTPISSVGGNRKYEMNLRDYKPQQISHIESI